MTTDPRPSIAELQRLEREHPDHPTHAVLLEIAAAAMALVGDVSRRGEGYTPEWNALVAATSKVAP